MQNRFTIPLAILAAGLIIAVSLFIYLRPAPAALVPAADLTQVRPIDATDHILGNPAAPIVFVEYSDIESPFGKNFEAVMEQVMAAYGTKGQVAWVYRHFPIVSQNPTAETDAEAAECVAAQGGTNAFFKFIDAIHAAAPGTAVFDPAQYGTVAQKLGIDADTLSKCLNAHTYQQRVMDDGVNALTAGATGAPYTIVYIKGQDPIPLSGTFSYSDVEQIIIAGLATQK